MQEVKTYTDDIGHQVNAFFDIDKETLETVKDKVEFKGIFPVMTNQGPLQLGCDFPEDYTLERCFEEFDNIARQTVEAKQKEQEEQNLIATPTAGGSGDIIIP